MRTITKEKRDRIIAMSRAGMTTDKICEFVGVSDATVYRIRKADGIVVPRNDGRNAKIPQATIDKILQMGRDGHSISAIARDCGVTEWTVNCRLRKAEIRAVNANRKIPQATIDKILQMGRDGHSVSEIAETCNVSRPTVRDHLNAAGIEPQKGKKIKKVKTETEPTTIPGMKKFKVVMELSNGKGSKLTREMDVSALSERDAINAAFREVSVKYSLHYKVIKSVQMIEENPTVETEVKPVEEPAQKPLEQKKVEEEPVVKNSGSHIKMISTTKTFEINGANSGLQYFIAIEKDIVRLSIDYKNGRPGMSVEFKLSEIDSVSEEVAEVLALIAAENGEKEA